MSTTDSPSTMMTSAPCRSAKCEGRTDNRLRDRETYDDSKRGQAAAPAPSRPLPTNPAARTSSAPTMLNGPNRVMLLLTRR